MIFVLFSEKQFLNSEFQNLTSGVSCHLPSNGSHKETSQGVPMPFLGRTECRASPKQPILEQEKRQNSTGKHSKHYFKPKEFHRVDVACSEVLPPLIWKGKAPGTELKRNARLQQ